MHGTTIKKPSSNLRPFGGKRNSTRSSKPTLPGDGSPSGFLRCPLGDATVLLFLSRSSKLASQLLCSGFLDIVLGVRYHLLFGGLRVAESVLHRRASPQSFGDYLSAISAQVPSAL